MYDVATGEPVGRLEARHRHWIIAVAFQPAGAIVATAGVDRVAQLWDTRTGALLGRPLEHKGYIYGLTFDPQGDLLATGSFDMTARVWKVTTGRPVGPPLIHATPVDKVAFSPRGHLLAAQSHDWNVRLWDYTTGLPVGPRAALDWAPQSIGFDPDSAALLISDAAGVESFAVPPPLEGTPAMLIPRLHAAVGIEPSKEQGNWPISAKVWERDHDPGGPCLFGPRMPAEDWDEQEAAIAERSNDWFAARCHLDRLVATHRGESLRECRARRALVLLRLDEPGEAERNIAAVDCQSEPPPGLADALTALALETGSSPDGRAAELAYRRALGIYERLAASHPDDGDARLDVIGTLNNFAEFLCRRGRADEGKPLASRAVAMARAQRPSDDWRLAFFLATLAETAVAERLLVEADPFYCRVARLWANLSTNPRARAEIEAHLAALLRRTRPPTPVSSASPPSRRR
jgi:hypothetical protein